MTVSALLWQQDYHLEKMKQWDMVQGWDAVMGGIHFSCRRSAKPHLPEPKLEVSF